MTSASTRQYQTECGYPRLGLKNGYPGRSASQTYFSLKDLKVSSHLHPHILHPLDNKYSHKCVFFDQNLTRAFLEAASAPLPNPGNLVCRAFPKHQHQESPSGVNLLTKCSLVLSEIRDPKDKQETEELPRGGNCIWRGEPGQAWEADGVVIGKHSPNTLEAEGRGWKA